MNALGGRDHCPHGFSVAIAGVGIQRGRVIGATDSSGESRNPENPVRIEDIHATILRALGINGEKEIMTPVGRPIALSEGRVIKELINS